jgi:outer membrane biosynthesis protein TonB
MIDSNPPVTTKQATSFDSLLVQCRDLVCERLAQALDGMLDKMDDTLSALIFETQDRDLRTTYLETRDKALEQRQTIAEQFRAHYLREFKVRSNRVKKIGQSFSDFDSSSLELNLVGEDDLNETLKLNDMATKLRQYCDEELAALDQRVGVLLGDANLEAEDNPFSPQAICDAFKHTCRNVDTNIKVRMVLLKLFDDHVLDDIRPVYKAVNALLVQNSILPKIRFSVSRGKEGSKAPPPGGRTGEEPPAAVPSDGPDFFSVLQDLLATNVKAKTQPGATGGTGASAPAVAGIPGFPPIAGTPGLGGADGAPLVVLQGAELMNLLTRVQHGDVTAVADGGPPLIASAGEPGTANVLRELKASSVGTGMNQLDSMTLDIVAMLFDQLFDDPKIPIAVKGLIGRMQIPMLKVAIADKEFFSKKTHPARRLLDTLGEISSRLPADFNASNPLFGRLEAIIQELMNNFQDNMEIFDVVRERLQNLVEEEDRHAEEEIRAAAKRIELNESLAASKTMAEFEVKTRVQAGKLPRPVIEFLVHQWVKPLLIVHVRRGQHSDAWKNSLATMDLLVWSVEAKHTPEERSKLATVVPDLLKRLTAGLKIADVEDAIRERFFSDLKKLHGEALSLGGKGEVAAAHDANAEKHTTKPDAALDTILDAVLATKPEAAPAAKPEAAPAAKPDAAPAAKPEATTPSTKPDAAPGTKPDAAPARKPEAAPAKKPEAAPVAKPAVAPVTKPVAAPAAKPVQPIPTTAGKARAPIAAHGEDSDSLDFTETLTIKNPFGGGKVHVKELESMDVRAAATPRAKGEVNDVEFINNLKEGTWVEFRETVSEDANRLGKLSYISPLRSSFLFVDQQGKTVKECTRTELARLVRLAMVVTVDVVVDEEPLFDRMMAGVIDKLR